MRGTHVYSKGWGEYGVIEGGLRQIDTCRQVSLMVNFQEKPTFRVWCLYNIWSMVLAIGRIRNTQYVQDKSKTLKNEQVREWMGKLGHIFHSIGRKGECERAQIFRFK